VKPVVAIVEIAVGLSLLINRFDAASILSQFARSRARLETALISDRERKRALSQWKAECTDGYLFSQ